MDRPAVQRPPVLADVARVAGVSIPTVSRVLTGSTPVAEKTRGLVMAAIEELGYRPNEAARALVKGRQSMVGVITSNTVQFGYGRTIQGVEEAARAAGLLVAITVVDSVDEAEVKAAVDLMLGQPLAGVIVLDFDIMGESALNALPATVPIVAVTSFTEGRRVRRVLFDDRLGGREATEYLLGLGHKTVHHVAVPSDGRPSGRMLGWREALEARGARVPDVIETDWSSQSGYRAGLALAEDPSVSAVFCGNDEIAFGVLRALQTHGRAVPGDVSVVGFDDHPHAALWTPPLTTMGEDFTGLGAAAFASLFDAESGATVPPSLFLVERESAAAPKS